jgi:hypothetical protein
MNHYSFEALVDGVPYLIKATPYTYNDEIRFLVNINNTNNEYIFVWDSSLQRLAVLNTEGIEIPDNVEEVIAAKLQSMAS